ncbi:MFS transporter [Spirochaetia bacterium]|nr:MFS transporter [Spirochaetia bacterium]
MTDSSKKTFIASNIIFLGLVSFFTDISTEMVYPILPLYLSSVMGASPTIIGIIEGIAESLASVIKLFSGIIADKYGNKKRMAFFGYSSSVLNKIVLLLSTTWAGILVARIIDRFGKGIRTTPRDALIAESSNKSQLGKAYGLHKGLDLLGTAIGILLAYIILSKNESDYGKIFLYSLIPAIIGVICIIFVKDNKEKIAQKNVSFNLKSIDKRLKIFLVFIFIFTLGNSSNAFILLRMYNAGFTAQNAILLYFLYNGIASVLSFPFGQLSDRIGRKNILCVGYFLYGIVYLGIGLFSNKIVFIVLFVIYGFYTALTTGIERALIVEIVPETQKASSLGLHSAIVGLGLLPASIIAGILWDLMGQSMPFIFGGIMAFITSIGIFILLSKKNIKHGVRQHCT